MEIEVNEYTMRYLESLHFDIVGYKTILTDILHVYDNNDKYSHNKETYECFMKDYLDCNRKYELLKNEIMNEYLPYDVRNEDYFCEFMFNKNMIKVTKNDKGCNICG